MKTSTKYFPEVRERAARMIREHQGGHGPHVSGDQFDTRKDRLHGGDAAPLGASGGTELSLHQVIS